MPLKEEFRSQGDLLFKYRSYFPIVIIMVGLAVYFNELAKGGDSLEYINSFNYQMVCYGIAAFGLLVRVLAIGFSADNTSGRNTTEGQIADTINKTGLYSIFRHPLYVGNYFMWLGIACLTANLWFIIAFTFMFWLYYERIMFAEEEYIRNLYGDAYVEWASRTPAFWPAFTKWKKPALKFSWVKIIRQEKAGILNLFLIMMVFNFINQYYFTDTVNIYNYASYLFAGSVVWYIIIKVIQKTTSVLELDRA